MNNEAPSFWRARGFWLGLTLALLSCLPVVVARYPQMTDYPAHLARYYVMLDGGHTPALARYYGFQWQWSGNVGVDLLIRPFATIFGLEAGARTVSGLIPPLTGLGILSVEWVLRRRFGFGSFIAFSFIWSPMMLFGLLNYALGQAVALWAFVGWVALARKTWRAPLFLGIGVVVWLCHISAWGMLGVMVAGYEWSREKSIKSLVAPWPLALPMAIMVVGNGVIGGPGGGFAYGAYWWIFKQAIWLKAMRDTIYPLDFLGEVAVLSAIGFAIAHRRIDGRLGWGALAMCLLSLVTPRHIAGGDYADYRMVTSGLMLAAMAIDWTPAAAWGRGLAVAGAVGLYLARLAVTTLSWQADSLETARLLAALDHIPDGVRVASAVLVPTGDWQIDHFEHIGDYAVIRRNALVNANFAVPHVHMLRLKVPYFTDPSHRIRQSAARRLDLSHFAPATAPWAGAQYLWYVGARRPDALPAGAVVIWQAPRELVARLAPAAASGSRSKPAPLANRAASH